MPAELFLGVGVAVAKLLLRAAGDNDTADAAGDARDLWAGIRAVRGHRGSQDAMGQVIGERLSARLAWSKEVDRQDLGATARDVANLLSRLADDDHAVIEARIHPERFHDYVMHHGGQTAFEQTPLAAEPFFEDVLSAAEDEYTRLAPSSPRFFSAGLKDVLLTLEDLPDLASDLRASVDSLREVLDAASTSRQLGLSDTGRVGTVAGTPLQHFGVHASLVDVPFLVRDATDQALTVLTTRRPLLLLGNSLAGKTRLGAQLLKQHCPEWRLLIPDVPNGLARLFDARVGLTDTVIWLDDLDRYVADPRDLQPRWLAQLIAAGNLVVATLREETYESFRPTGSLSSTQWPLLEDFTRVRVNDTNQDERRRLAAAVEDPVTAAGVLRHGLGCYLAGGYLALDALDNARTVHPVADALIRAAVDWARAGIGEAIPQATAKELVPAYLTGLAVRQRETPNQAIAWATSWDTGRDAFRLLEPDDDDTTWRPFDYLRDHITRQGTAIPAATWDAIVRAEASASNLATAAYTAWEAQGVQTAEQLWRRAAELGDTRAMTNLGTLLEGRGQGPEAEQLWRRAAELGDTRAMYKLAIRILLEGRGQEPEAEQFYRQAAELGNAGAMVLVGALLARRGQGPEAEQFYRRAAELGDTTAISLLGNLLTGREEEAAV